MNKTTQFQRGTDRQCRRGCLGHTAQNNRPFKPGFSRQVAATLCYFGALNRRRGQRKSLKTIAFMPLPPGLAAADEPHQLDRKFAQIIAQSHQSAGPQPVDLGRSGVARFNCRDAQGLRCRFALSAAFLR
jgi:hypothetical protein